VFDERVTLGHDLLEHKDLRERNDLREHKTNDGSHE
jgi:hypothetical protein